MVQVRGKPQVIDDATWVRVQLDQLTNNHKNKREHSWKVSDAPDDFIAAQLKGIVGVEIPILSIAGKWKVSQNRLSVDRQGVIAGLRTEGTCPAMLNLMERG